jgi:hypothetical protein
MDTLAVSGVVALPMSEVTDGFFVCPEVVVCSSPIRFPLLSRRNILISRRLKTRAIWGWVPRSGGWVPVKLREICSPGLKVPLSV